MIEFHLIPGACLHCDWYYVGTGYPEVVKAYQDHLRDQHPDGWVKA